MKDEISSQKPLAVITGASSGIGYELAKQFAKNGFDLVICAEDAGIKNCAKELRGMGAKTIPVQADLATFKGVEELRDRVMTLQHPVDALVLNAGVGVGGEFAETDLKAELNLIELNIVSPIHLVKCFVNHMATRGQGRILFTSSIASVMPAPYLAVYGASKAFIQSFSDALRNELKETGVTVTALLPGPTETNFFERAGMQSTKVGSQKKDDPAVVAQQGFEAMMAGKDRVVAGSLLNRIQAVAAKILPDALTAQAQGMQTKPGSAKGKTDSGKPKKAA